MCAGKWLPSQSTTVLPHAVKFRPPAPTGSRTCSAIRFLQWASAGIASRKDDSPNTQACTTRRKKLSGCASFDVGGRVASFARPSRCCHSTFPAATKCPFVIVFKAMRWDIFDAGGGIQARSGRRRLHSQRFHVREMIKVTFPVPHAFFTTQHTSVELCFNFPKSATY